MLCITHDVSDTRDSVMVQPITFSSLARWLARDRNGFSCNFAGQVMSCRAVRRPRQKRKLFKRIELIC
jgi:hypothetical protein